MSLSWIPHTATSSTSAYRFYTPQMSPFTSPKVQSNSLLATNDDVNLGLQSTRRRNNNNRRMSKSAYKHVPHKDKPPHLVARRNARERKRVQAVNSAFAKLRKCVPIENRNKRLSKVKTLHRAIEYINGLQALLHQTEDPNFLPNSPTVYSRYRTERSTSQEDDELEDEERVFSDFGDYLVSDMEIVNKENKNQRWGVSGVSLA